jgi:hypothetical protein
VRLRSFPIARSRIALARMPVEGSGTAPMAIASAKSRNPLAETGVCEQVTGLISTTSLPFLLLPVATTRRPDPVSHVYSA